MRKRVLQKLTQNNYDKGKLESAEAVAVGTAEMLARLLERLEDSGLLTEEDISYII